MPHKGTKKITEVSFRGLKKLITKHGVDEAVEQTGYSRRTILSVEKASNHTAWRDARRRDAKASKKPRTEASPTTAAPQPAKVEKPSAPYIKPMIPLLGVQPKAAPRPTDFVTRAEVDRALKAFEAEVRGELRDERRSVEGLRKDVADAKSATKSLRAEVKPLIEADTAMAVAEVTLVKRKNFWQRLRDRF